MKLCIGIPTFDRKRLVECCALSLRCARHIGQASILVRDDCSTKYDVAFLKLIFPDWATISMNEVNSGRADYAVHRMMLGLLDTDCDALMLLDSDCIVSIDFIEAISRYLPETDGVLSLFNAPAHKGIAVGELIEKETVGSTGTVWRRELMQDVIDHVPPSGRFDWDFSAYLRSKRRRILTVRSSKIQHLGFAGGQNSRAFSGDFGLGFSDERPDSAHFILEAIVSALPIERAQLQDETSELRTKTTSLEDEIRKLRTETTSLAERVVSLERTSVWHNFAVAWQALTRRLGLGK
jgi:hypothetical protein